jgi:hypothetical protein
LNVASPFDNKIPTMLSIHTGLQIATRLKAQGSGMSVAMRSGYDEAAIYEAAMRP